MVLCVCMWHTEQQSIVNITYICVSIFQLSCRHHASADQNNVGKHNVDCKLCIWMLDIHVWQHIAISVFVCVCVEEGEFVVSCCVSKWIGTHIGTDTAEQIIVVCVAYVSSYMPYACKLQCCSIRDIKTFCLQRKNLTVVQCHKTYFIRSKHTHNTQIHHTCANLQC